MKKTIQLFTLLFLIFHSTFTIHAQHNSSSSSWFNFEGMSWFMQGSKFDASELSVSVKDYIQQSVYLGKVDSTSNVFYRLNSSYEFTMNGIPTRQFLIRNDSVNKRIYIRPLFDENIEHLLYDFSLKVGDTVKSIMLTNLKAPLIVSKVETVEINGIKRIQISALLKGVKSERTIKFIEGIGTTNGFLVLIDLSSKEAISLKCVHKNKILIYNTDSNCPEPEVYLKPKRPGGK